jgi:hypothetical protein
VGRAVQTSRQFAPSNRLRSSGALQCSQAMNREMNPQLSNGKAFVAHRWGLVLLAANLAGAIVYVGAASHAWIPAQERALGINSVTGEPYVWALSVFPIWAAFLLLNIVWGALLIARQQWRRGIWWLLTIPVWLVAMAVDFAHH